MFKSAQGSAVNLGINSKFKHEDKSFMAFGSSTWYGFMP
jgi:hypothetical protein